MAEPPKRSRLEDEVLEILNKSERETPAPVRLKTSADRSLWRARLATRRWSGPLLSRLRGGGMPVVLAGIVVAVLANVAVEPISPLFARLLVYAAIAAIVLGVVQLYRSPAGRGGKMWRGKRVDMGRPGIDWDDRADQWRRRR